MRKMKYILLITVILFYRTINAQNIQNDKIESSFTRPALTNLYIDYPKYTDEYKIIEMLKNKPIPARFDDHSINNAKDINAQKLQNQSLKSIVVEDYSRDIIAKWYDRNKQGIMSDKLINFRGNYTANDDEVSIDNQSNISRVSNLGYELIKKTYVIVYNITELKKTNSTGSEGYETRYSAKIYKLNWNDSIRDIFFDKYYVNDSTPYEYRNRKIQDFQNITFSFSFVTEITGYKINTQSTDYGSYVLSRPKTMLELLQDAANEIHEEVFFLASQDIDDFNVKVHIKSVYPTHGKIGTKEGIYLGQRFAIYKYDEKKNKKIRKGYVRVKLIANTDGISDGKTDQSVFRQVGGRKLKTYYYLESKEDEGLSWTLGSSFNDSSASAGYFMTLDIRNDFASKTYQPGIKSKNRITGISLIAKPFNRQIFGDDTKDSTSSGSSFNLSLSLGRELYIGKKGHAYLFPEISASLLGYYFTEIGGVKIKFENEKSLFLNYSINTAIGLGVNLTPSISFLIKPTYSIRLNDFKSLGEEKIKLSNEERLKNIDKNSSPVFLGVRFRF